MAGPANTPSPAESGLFLRSQSRKLLDQVRERVTRLGYNIRTEHAYAQWAKRFVLFHGKRQSRVLDAAEGTTVWVFMMVPSCATGSAMRRCGLCTQAILAGLSDARCGHSGVHTGSSSRRK